MEHKNFIVKPYDFKKDEDILELLNSVFSPWGGDKDYFKWKYKTIHDHDNDFPCAWVIECENRIIAFNGYRVRPLKNNGKTYYIAQSFDTAISSDYRGYGLFQMIQERVESEMVNYNISFIYGWTSEAGFHAFTRKMKWTKWNCQRYLMKILDPKHFIDSKVKHRYVAYPLEILLRGMNRFFSARHQKQITVSLSHEFGSEIDDFMKKTSPFFDTITSRNALYLDWRLKTPKEQLVLIKAKKNGTLSGFSVFKECEDAIEVYELLYISIKTLSSLLFYIENQGCKMDKKKVLFRVNHNHPFMRDFYRLGYFKSNTMFNLLGKHLGDSGIDFNNTTQHWTFFDRNE